MLTISSSFRMGVKAVAVEVGEMVADDGGDTAQFIAPGEVAPGDHDVAVMFD